MTKLKNKWEETKRCTSCTSSDNIHNNIEKLQYSRHWTCHEYHWTTFLNDSWCLPSGPPNTCQSGGIWHVLRASYTPAHKATSWPAETKNKMPEMTFASEASSGCLLLLLLSIQEATVMIFFNVDHSHSSVDVNTHINVITANWAPQSSSLV